MTPRPQSPRKEIELKLALISADPSELKIHLPKALQLGKYLPTKQHLHSIYFDTPEQFLRSRHAALRLRRTDKKGHSQWIQTLKLGCKEASALNQRYELETILSAPRLDSELLTQKSWVEIDPKGLQFAKLAPVFSVDVERTCWMVHLCSGSVVEIALDIGKIKIGKKSIPIFELEFELKAGKRAALLDLALKLSRTVAVLPLPTSKAERGYALTDGNLELVMRANSPNLKNVKSLQQTVGFVLREMVIQFTVNINALLISEKPEVVHQARVGWRRFREALWLFKPILKPKILPALTTLKPLVQILGAIRDLDVALNETLPPLMDVFTSGNPKRIASWNLMIMNLRSETISRRKFARTMLSDPTIGTAMVLITQWVDEMCAAQENMNLIVQPTTFLRQWGYDRISKLHKQLKFDSKRANDPEKQHRLRITAKRMRYCIEAMRTLLPKHQTKRWYEEATSMQVRLGFERDVINACSLVQKLERNHEISEFLRGQGLKQLQQT